MKELDLKKDFKKSVEGAVRVLKLGGLLIYPTDTIYGIGCNALDLKAVKKVFEIKKRDWKKNVSVIVRDGEMLENLAVVSTKDKKFFEKLFPGAVTLVFKKKNEELVVGGSDGIGIRIPNLDFTKAMMRELDFPVVTTSVNISGDQVWEGKGELPLAFQKVDLLIKGGTLKSESSTIIDLRGEPPKLLKEGKVSWKKIKEILGEDV
jgi:L-threonylcarbamoyladenylate synthase